MVGQSRTAVLPLVVLVGLGLAGSCGAADRAAENEFGKDPCALKIVAGSQLALTPPMGWNSWNGFGRDVNEQVIRETADAFVQLGLRDLGYRYIVVDDYWHGGRDANGCLYPDGRRFPSGMKALGEYVHGRGLKFGIYSCAGDKTCGGQPASNGYEQKDAQTFASWGVDFLKYDYCHAPDDYRVAVERYTEMGSALKATGRPIVFSVCEWGVRSPWLWARQTGGNMWRVGFDVVDIWDLPRNIDTPIGILTAVDVMADLERYAGPGGWNDPDMLVIGLGNKGFIKGGGCTNTEYRTQMSMWCMLAAPLMIGCDIRNMPENIRQILANPEVIAVDQDPLGKQGYRVARKGGLEVWKKPLSGGRLAVGLLNRGEEAADICAYWKALELDPKRPCEVRELWKHQDLGVFWESFSANVEAHECRMLLMKPQ